MRLIKWENDMNTFEKTLGNQGGLQLYNQWAIGLRMDSKANKNRHDASLLTNCIGGLFNLLLKTGLKKALCKDSHTARGLCYGLMILPIACLN